jgi:radical SAM superfamily enzyme YgiQ (UPF0313 family)
VAKIAVISCNDRCCMGARQLSSLVKDRHAFCLICYGEYNHATFRETAYIGQESDEQLLLELLGQLRPDLVGFSYRSIQADLAAHLAARIQSKLNLPVIMGGIGATSDPERAIQKSPIVCIGEADFILPALLDAIDETGSVDLAVRKTPNLWYHTDSGIAKNPLARLVSKEELSDFPFMDYEPDNKFSIVRGTLMENDGRYDNDVGAYPMLTSRGCPFACTFCHNSTVHDLYCGQKYCRQRSVASVIAEMERAKARPDTTMFSIYDDLFNVNRRWTLEFASEYGKRIQMPFWCYTHPLAVKKDVHQALLDVGLNNTAMGIQSGSERTLYRLYNRKTPRHRILESAAILKELNCRVQIDLITANPFEDDSDRRDTLDLMQAMPKITRRENPVQPWYYCLSRLTFFPNSQISQRLEKEGINPEFDPDLASFWEMLYELALMDDLPQGAVMYLSYLFDDYKQNSEDFRPETGAHWIRTRLLGHPMPQISGLLDAAGDETEPTARFVPNPEDLHFSSVRALMDAWESCRVGTVDETRGETLKEALKLLDQCRPSPKTEAVTPAKPADLNMHLPLVRRLHSGLLHRFPRVDRIEGKLRIIPTLRRLLGRS